MGGKVMKVKLSKYLESQKSVLQNVVNILSEDYDYVSILGVDTKGKSYKVRKSSTSLEDSVWFERGYVLRVHNGKNYSEYSFNVIDEDVNTFTNKLKQELDRNIKAMSDISNPQNEYPVVEEEALMDSFLSEIEIDPATVSVKEKIAKLTETVESGLKSSDEVIDFIAAYEDVHISKVFVSKQKTLEQAYVWSSGFLEALARREDETKFFYRTIGDMKGVELLHELCDLKDEVIEGALKLLSSGKVEPGEYDIICAPDIAGLIAHEAFGHGVEMDMFVKNRAKAIEYLDKPVGSEHVSMKDGAKSAYSVSSYLFDDEGSLGTDTQVIEKGILKSGISDMLSALKLGTKPTGNGKRENFERKAYSRMTNTFFTAGEHKLDDMIKTIDKGYLLEGILSGMEDPKNWGIQCMVLQGKEILGGKLTGKVVSPVIMTGYVPDVLSSIDMVSDTIEIDGAGSCGKGHKEWVKTADGGPYIKAKGRLG